MKTLNRVLFVSSLLLGSITLSQAQPLDRVVAIVDQAPVLASDIGNRLRFLKLQADARGQEFPPVSPQLEQRVIDRLIEEQALLKEANRQGFSVSDEQVNQALNNLASRLGLTGGIPQLAGVMEQYGIPFDRVRADTRADLLINAAQRRAVQNEVMVTDQEAQALIEREGLNQGQVKLSQILIGLAQAPTSEQLQQAQSLANEALTQLNQGTRFEDVARAYSQGPNAISGGDLGWREISGLNAEFKAALSQLAANDVTPIFRTRAGLHILKVDGQRTSDTALVEEVNSRHILLRPNAVRDVEQTRAALAYLQRQIEQGADFAKLAEQFSEDPVSASNGGELGWTNPEAYVPEFQAALAFLEPGERSDLIQTQFGWHLIELIDRRQLESVNTDQLERAKNIILQRQADEVAAAWTRRIVSNAFIERL